MSDATSPLWLWLVLIFIIFSRVSSADQEKITVKPGQTVTLPCQAPNNNSTMAVQWSIPDLEPEYVLLYRDGHFDPTKQNPSLKDRVDLQDREMKDEDVSLILKNVSVNDTGTYECRVFQRQTKHRKRAILSTHPICIITLSVASPGQPRGTTGGKEDGVSRGHSGLIVSLSVLAVLIAAAAVLIYRKHKLQNQDSYQPPAQQQLTETSQTNSQLDCESLSNEGEKDISLCVSILVNSLDRSLQLGEKLQAYKEKILTL